MKGYRIPHHKQEHHVYHAIMSSPSCMSCHHVISINESCHPQHGRNSSSNHHINACHLHQVSKAGSSPSCDQGKVISINVHHVIKARHVNSNMTPRPSSSTWAPSSSVMAQSHHVRATPSTSSRHLHHLGSITSSGSTTSNSLHEHHHQLHRVVTTARVTIR